jgi:hypothetical protein
MPILFQKLFPKSDPKAIYRRLGNLGNYFLGKASNAVNKLFKKGKAVITKNAAPQNPYTALEILQAYNSDKEFITPKKEGETVNAPSDQDKINQKFFYRFFDEFQKGYKLSGKDYLGNTIDNVDHKIALLHGGRVLISVTDKIAQQQQQGEQPANEKALKKNNLGIQQDATPRMEQDLRPTLGRLFGIQQDKINELYNQMYLQKAYNSKRGGMLSLASLSSFDSSDSSQDNKVDHPLTYDMLISILLDQYDAYIRASSHSIDDNGNVIKLKGLKKWTEGTKTLLGLGKSKVMQLAIDIPYPNNPKNKFTMLLIFKTDEKGYLEHYTISFETIPTLEKRYGKQPDNDDNNEIHGPDAKSSKESISDSPIKLRYSKETKKLNLNDSSELELLPLKDSVQAEYNIAKINPTEPAETLTSQKQQQEKSPPSPYETQLLVKLANLEVQPFSIIEKTYVIEKIKENEILQQIKEIEFSASAANSNEKLSPEASLQQFEQLTDYKKQFFQLQSLIETPRGKQIADDLCSPQSQNVFNGMPDDKYQQLIKKLNDEGRESPQARNEYISMICKTMIYRIERAQKICLDPKSRFSISPNVLKDTLTELPNQLENFIQLEDLEDNKLNIIYADHFQSLVQKISSFNNAQEGEEEAAMPLHNEIDILIKEIDAYLRTLEAQLIKLETQLTTSTDEEDKNRLKIEEETTIKIKEQVTKFKNDLWLSSSLLPPKIIAPKPDKNLQKTPHKNLNFVNTNNIPSPSLKPEQSHKKLSSSPVGNVLASFTGGAVEKTANRVISKIKTSLKSLLKSLNKPLIKSIEEVDDTSTLKNSLELDMQNAQSKENRPSSKLLSTAKKLLNPADVSTESNMNALDLAQQNFTDTKILPNISQELTKDNLATPQSSNKNTTENNTLQLIKIYNGIMKELKNDSEHILKNWFNTSWDKLQSDAKSCKINHTFINNHAEALSRKKQTNIEDERDKIQHRFFIYQSVIESLAAILKNSLNTCPEDIKLLKNQVDTLFQLQTTLSESTLQQDLTKIIEKYGEDKKNILGHAEQRVEQTKEAKERKEREAVFKKVKDKSDQRINKLIGKMPKPN